MSHSERRWELFIQMGALLFGLLVFSMTVVLVLAGTILPPESSAALAAEPQRVGIANHEALLDALRGAGGFVTVAGGFRQPFFKADARVVYLEDEQLLVFEYPDEGDRQRESESISLDGNSVGGTSITWTDQPNFWADGRVIVEYLGTEQVVIRLLCDVLGPSITSHEQVSAR